MSDEFPTRLHMRMDQSADGVYRLPASANVVVPVKRVDETYPPHIIQSAREWRLKNGRSY